MMQKTDSLNDLDTINNPIITKINDPLISTSTLINDGGFLEYVSQPEILAIIAIIVSVCAMLFSVFYNRATLKATVKHNKLSVRPILTTEFDHSKIGTLNITLKNAGLGPAMIKGLEFKYLDYSFPTIHQLLQKLFDDDHIASTNHMQETKYIQMSDYSMSAQSSNIIYSMVFSDKLEDLHISLSNKIGKFRIYVKYADIYGTPFKLNTTLIKR